MEWNKLSRWEKVAYITILVLAIASRLYLLGNRVMSHDESLHTKYAWYLYAGQGYTHNPMMHGPLLFHTTALNYFLFGVNDFVARLFPAILGIALVMTPLLFRRWLGQWGALLTSVMLLISPSITYYSRYIRHDVELLLTALLLLWAILNYLEEGKFKWLYVLAAVFSLMYTTKEACYLYTAIFGTLLAIPFILNVLLAEWKRPQFYSIFLLVLVLVIVMGTIFAFGYLKADVQESSLDPAGNTRVAHMALVWWARAAAVIAVVGVVGAMGLAFYGMGEENIRENRLFDVLMVLGTLTLPLGSAFLVQMAGIDMLTLYNALIANNMAALFGPELWATVVILAVVLAASCLLGIWWDRHWLILAGIHYAIFIVLYTTVFTNPIGIFSGMLGSLAYWMAQQGVERGGQPWYYYFVVAPLYDYLPILLSLGSGVGALVFALRRGRARIADAETAPARAELDIASFWPLFLLGWMLLSWIIYSWAGERMPWLEVHLALPSIFLAGWGVGCVLQGLDRVRFIQRQGWLALLSLPLVVTGLVILGEGMQTLAQAQASPAGSTLAQLQEWGLVFGGLLGLLIFGSAFIWAGMRLGAGQIARLAVAALFIALSLVTVRTMTAFNYVNYDMATEFLVYAHAGPDVKVALGQIDEVSWRTTGAAHDVAVAYSEDGSWPLSWYMTAYPNAYFYGTTPDPSRLLESPVIIAGAAQYDAVDAIVGNQYIYFDYTYLWWPIQDYFNLTWERIRFAFTDPTMRAALWDIFWDRDYRAYAAATDQTLTANTWPLRKDFRLYVRRDLAHEIWSYRVGMEGGEGGWTEPQPTFDPYAMGARALPLISTVNLPTGATPRGLAVAPDGTLYAADTANHRIWHLSQQGVLGSWGEQGSGPGQFNEPWGIAVDAAGYVYVADTWNHRVQKFDAQGNYLAAWGETDIANSGEITENAFFGPRGIAVGPDGNLYITDTGNKRIQVFSAEGTLLRTFGAPGWEPGQFNEPVGIAVTATEIFVVDTWNRRIQVFDLAGVPLRNWSISVWDLSDPEDKPYLALGADGHVYAGDPLGGRVLAFTGDGTYLWSTGQFSDTGVGLTYPEGLAISSNGILYIADAHTGRILGYSLP